MRIATYNLESLDLPPRAKRSIEERVAMLAPELQRARADVVCLQEVNAQSDPGHHHRSLRALDRLLEDTPYTHYHRSVSEMNIGRWVIWEYRWILAVLRTCGAQPTYRPVTAGVSPGLTNVCLIGRAGY